MSGFIKFIREQGVIGLAVGFILGAAVSDLVGSLVRDIINPIIGFLIGSTEGLAEINVGVVSVGAFISVLIDFFIIAAVVYWIFRILKLDKLDLKKK